MAALHLLALASQASIYVVLCCLHLARYRKCAKWTVANLLETAGMAIAVASLTVCKVDDLALDQRGFLTGDNAVGKLLQALSTSCLVAWEAVKACVEGRKRKLQGMSGVVYVIVVRVQYLGFGPYSTANSTAESSLEVASVVVAAMELMFKLVVGTKDGPEPIRAKGDIEEDWLFESSPGAGKGRLKRGEAAGVAAVVPRAACSAADGPRGGGTASDKEHPAIPRDDSGSAGGAQGGSALPGKRVGELAAAMWTRHALDKAGKGRSTKGKGKSMEGKRTVYCV